MTSVWHHRVLGPLLRIALGYVLLVEGLVQLAFGRIDVPFVDVPWLEVGARASSIPRGVFVSGAVVGTLYALVAMGLILVYRANRIINFAQAQLGAVPAVLAILLVVRQGFSYWTVVPIALVGGLLLGGAVEVGIVRRFRTSSRLILTVATVGIGFLLLVLEFLTKLGVTGDLLIVEEFPTPFSAFAFGIGPVTLRGDHLVAVVVSVAVLAGLAAFFRFTDVGVAVRAAADNRSRAALLGIPVDRMSTIVWALAGVLSAIGVFLRVPLVGLPLSGFVGPLFLLYGLAAAVIARMERLSTALVAGMFIGIADFAAIFATRRSSLAAAAMLVVILVALLVQRHHLSRAEEVGSWETVRELRSIPSELRGLREVRVARGVLIAVGIAFAVALPWLVGDVRTPFATIGVVYAMVGVSLVVLTGWAGQISLGQFAIAGIGAAVAGGLAANHGWDFFGAVLTAGLVGAGVAVLVGLPALRIQGLYLAVTTLAFAFAVEGFVLNPEFFGWLLPRSDAFLGPPLLYGRVDLGADSRWLGITVPTNAKYYLVTLAFLALALGMARSVRRYRSGRVFIGVRDNTRMLQSYGVSPAGTRLAAFAISGFIAALAGALFVFQQGAVDAGTYTPEQSIQLFVMTVLGGIGSLAGALLGAGFLVALPLFGLRDLPVVGPVVEILGTGLGVLLVLYFLPGGLAEGVWRVRDHLLRRLATRRGIVVPSLVADVATEQVREEDLALALRAPLAGGTGGDS
ncbi:MAG: ABC transporter permease [Nitriliruptorales bacterium]